jgi:hypothetical protein
MRWFIRLVGALTLAATTLPLAAQAHKVRLGRSLAPCPCREQCRCNKFAVVWMRGDLIWGTSYHESEATARSYARQVQSRNPQDADFKKFEITCDGCGKSKASARRSADQRAMLESLRENVVTATDLFRGGLEEAILNKAERDGTTKEYVDNLLDAYESILRLRSLLDGVVAEGCSDLAAQIAFETRFMVARESTWRKLDIPMPDFVELSGSACNAASQLPCSLGEFLRVQQQAAKEGFLVADAHYGTIIPGASDHNNEIRIEVSIGRRSQNAPPMASLLWLEKEDQWLRKGSNNEWSAAQVEDIPLQAIILRDHVRNYTTITMRDTYFLVYPSR